MYTHKLTFQVNLPEYEKEKSHLGEKNIELPPVRCPYNPKFLFL